MYAHIKIVGTGRKIHAIKALRECAKNKPLGLREAKDIVDHTDGFYVSGNIGKLLTEFYSMGVEARVTMLREIPVSYAWICVWDDNAKHALRAHTGEYTDRFYNVTEAFVYSAVGAVMIATGKKVEYGMETADIHLELSE